jgi:hypothetical protein
MYMFLTPTRTAIYYMIDRYTRLVDRENAPRQTKPHLSWPHPKSGHESRRGSAPRRTDWPTDWLVDRLTGLTGWLAGRLTDWLTDRLTRWPTDWLAGWLTDWLTDRQLQSGFMITFLFIGAQILTLHWNCTGPVNNNGISASAIFAWIFNGHYTHTVTKLKLLEVLRNYRRLTGSRY